MKPLTRSKPHHAYTWGVLCLIAALMLLFQGQAQALTVNVVTKDGAAISGGFRWLLEEDNTNQTPPGIPTAYSIGLDIHKGHAPAVDSGISANPSDSTLTVPDASRPYFISVLPHSGYAMGGAPVPVGASSVNVVVAPYAAYNAAFPNDPGIPTAQISLLAFEDNFPINNAPDIGNESGLAGFTVVLFDNAGQVMQDAFGNMLGTQYITDVDGNLIPDPDNMGTGIIRTDINGEALIKNLAPNKYGLQVIPPTLDPVTGEPVNWIQTATIEGTPTIDAWVKANEPAYFTEGFGVGGVHAAFGFVNPDNLAWSAGTPGGATISGRNAYNHFSRPPLLQGFHAGAPVAECYVGLNDPVTGEGLTMAECDADSNFILDGIPPGTYELVTWDKPLIALFGANTVTVPDTNPVDLGNVLSFRWFGTYEGTVFEDLDEDGFRDPGEVGIAEQAVNVRFRDGTLYKTQPTDVEGGFELAEIFPFFKWLITEVDFARFKATGMTAIVDFGGPVDPAYEPSLDTTGWDPRAVGVLHPQPQATVNPNTGYNLSRTETGPVLTQAMLLFLNQTNIMDWGKKAYAPGENGGISGIVTYDVTRDTDDPALAAIQDWEPGIPRAQVNLYQDNRDNSTGLPAPDGKIDDLNHDGAETLADVDNYPFGNFPGAEDIDQNLNGTFDAGDAIQIAYTDSFDDDQPSGCIQTLPVINGEVANECFDNFGTWNQIRPGVFDGGFAFDSYVPGGLFTGGAERSPLPSGTYIVEAANPNPKAYVLVKEEDKNVDFGDTYTPSPLLLAPACVGDDHLVPDYLALFKDQMIPSVYSGETRPLCDRKQVVLSSGDNTGVNFFYFTEVPKAARAVGFVNNDLAAEFDPTSPIFGEKAAPAWIPVAFRDWQGVEVTRVYTDQFGTYNAMLPSTFSVNIPTPTGVALNMLTLVLNDPGPILDTNPSSPTYGEMIIDPQYDERFSTSPWTLHYEPGRTSYLDTPLVPVAAFVTLPPGTLDTNPVDGTPAIGSVGGTDPAMALVCTEQLSDPALATLTITAATSTAADVGFGETPGQVSINGFTSEPGGDITIDSWTPSQIVISFDPATVTGGQLTIIRGDNGLATESTVTVQVVADCTSPTVHIVSGGSIWPENKIQNAIDAASPGDLILVGPGDYFENVIMWQPVRLQGAGANQTRIQANPNPAERLQAWHQYFVDNGLGGPFNANESPGIFVIGLNDGSARDFDNAPSLIDGFTISGSLAGGGIAVYSDATGLQISNNNVRNNQGNWGGGITVGDPEGNVVSNADVKILNNRVASNGGIFGPGGIALFTGSDNYLVEGNRIAGNFSRSSGGGIAHVGVSNGGTIRDNTILFNEVFYGQIAAGGGYGGGIYLGGEVLLGTAISTGAGDVTIEDNLIQGNLAGAGSGGGIAAFGFNGADVQNNPTNAPADPDGPWYTLDIRNNMIVNNVAALGGGGISLQDVTAGHLLNNTVAHNDSTATALLAFPAGNLTVSSPQAGGIVSAMHSAALSAIGGFTQTYSDPEMLNNILWGNRSFFNDATLSGGQGGLLPASQHATSDAAYAAALLAADPASTYVADASAYPDTWNLQVVGATSAADRLHPGYTLLDSLSGPQGEDYSGNNNFLTPNIDPGFVKGYHNTLNSSSVIDEGGNFVSVRFTPLAESSGDYHLLTACSPAVDQGTDVGITSDIDGDSRPLDSGFDIGADEFTQAPMNALALAVIQPNGGEFIPAGTSYTLRWEAPDYGVATRFQLAYSTGPGSPNRLIANVVDGYCYSWQVPGDIHSGNVNFGVVARDNVTSDVLARDFSDAAFTIDVIALQQPNGGEVLTSGNTYSILWTSNYAPETVARVGLWYKTSPGNNWTPIATTGNTGRYDWIVPNVTTATTNASVALILYNAAGQPLLSDVNDTSFTILPSLPAAAAAPAAAPAAATVTPLASIQTTYTLEPTPTTATTAGVELLIPNGGEVFTPGQKVPVLWMSPTSSPASSVVLSYSADDGNSWNEVATLASDTEFYEWSIPNDAALTQAARLKIERFDADGTLIDSDQSNDPFSLDAGN